MTLTKSKYYFEALDNYPYYLSDCLEALHYALSYDSEDSDSLCLMGRVYSEISRDYETAKSYFEEAMLYNVNNINTPQYYIKCLLDNEDLEEAEKLISYSLQIKGIDKCKILMHQSLFYEIKQDFKQALKILKEAKNFAYSQSVIDGIIARERFIKKKLAKKTKSKKSPKKKKAK